MKQVLSILFILVVLGNTLSLPAYYLYYNLNKAYITELFCINKEKVQMKCHGKCHLSKVTQNLVTKRKGEATNFPVIEERIPMSLFLENKMYLKFSDLPFSRRSLPSFVHHYQFLHRQTVFHPPQRLV